ncbi:hypothetical protein PAI11_26110 [Patulibacter medicamentivorans]|uniref:Secreted protein n=1 Tax=Patulibacter medicamentivorans TaxID=1097667 RepID=H0E709_9ACTN|nr:hypothetical protein [Patulibacter medicamentivorans]EHN10504.1 hypothetical protein PAI11_26110 [Patulibacter medicamentivorans]
MLVRRRLLAPVLTTALALGFTGAASPVTAGAASGNRGCGAITAKKRGKTVKAGVFAPRSVSCRSAKTVGRRFFRSWRPSRGSGQFSVGGGWRCAGSPGGVQGFCLRGKRSVYLTTKRKSGRWY